MKKLLPIKETHLKPRVFSILDAALFIKLGPTSGLQIKSTDLIESQEGDFFTYFEYCTRLVLSGRVKPKVILTILKNPNFSFSDHSKTNDSENYMSNIVFSKIFSDSDRQDLLSALLGALKPTDFPTILGEGNQTILLENCRPMRHANELTLEETQTRQLELLSIARCHPRFSLTRYCSDYCDVIGKFGYLVNDTTISKQLFDRIAHLYLSTHLKDAERFPLTHHQLRSMCEVVFKHKNGTFPSTQSLLAKVRAPSYDHHPSANFLRAFRKLHSRTTSKEPERLTESEKRAFLVSSPQQDDATAFFRGAETVPEFLAQKGTPEGKKLRHLAASCQKIFSTESSFSKHLGTFMETLEKYLDPTLKEALEEEYPVWSEMGVTSNHKGLYFPLPDGDPHKPESDEGTHKKGGANSRERY